MIVIFGRILITMVYKTRNYFLIYLFFVFPCFIFSKSLTVYKKNNLYGLLDNNLKIIVNAEYKHISISNDKRYFYLNTKTESNACFIINSDGKICWNGAAEDYIEPIFGEYFFDMKQTESGINFILINAKSRSEKKLNNAHEIFQVKNTSEHPDSFSVRYNSEGAIYNLDLKRKKIEKQMEKLNRPLVFPEINGAMAYGRGKGIINSNGKVIAKDLIDCAFNFTQGLMPVITNSKSGFINNNGDFVFLCPIFYEKSSGGYCPSLNCNFSEGYAFVPTERFSGTIYNLNGDIIKNQLPYLSDYVYTDGWICVYDKNEKYNFLSHCGNKISDSDFDYAEQFVNGYAIIKINGKDAIIDTKGNIFYSEDLKE